MKEQACYMQENEKTDHADVTDMLDLVPSQSVSLYKKKKIGKSLENTEVITNIKNVHIIMYNFTFLPNKNDTTTAHININNLLSPEEVKYGKALLRRKL